MLMSVIMNKLSHAEFRYLSHVFQNINTRCYNQKSLNFKHYGGKGIKNLLTLDQLIVLWKRDRANDQIRPSIDRIDSDKHYCLENCRFIELSENISRATGRRYSTGRPKSKSPSIHRHSFRMNDRELALFNEKFKASKFSDKSDFIRYRLVGTK